MVAWDRLRNLFQDNKGTRVVHLESQFGATYLEDFFSLAKYCQSLKTISMQVTPIGHQVSEERLVLQLVAHLTDEYAMIATIIQQTVPLPNFDKACSMLDLDRTSHHKSKKGTSSSSIQLVGSGGHGGRENGGRDYDDCINRGKNGLGRGRGRGYCQGGGRGYGHGGGRGYGHGRGAGNSPYYRWGGP
ncbi:uncharacterized protein LOC133805724 [Humulus lupulus]|uniref:uncharacterized protein LOC133805724 n=1 Tax=Humulus lupulus TaxID=3486 RepID=UPI002B408DFD|nr:uncharacterized protein LOC133805724 [Humulus lupulus]